MAKAASKRRRLGRNTTYTLEFFITPIAPAVGQEQGKKYIGTVTITTDGSGNASFTAVLSAAQPVGQYITATATDPQNDTSAFSNATKVS
jgi:hypothetical protein